MLRADGQIHIDHKTTSPWRIDELALESYLTLIECVDLKKEDYPGYSHKRCAGSRCDKPFRLGKCSTYKFIHCQKAMESEIRSYNAYTGSKQQRMNETKPSENGSRNEHCPILGGCSRNVADRLQRAPHDADFFTHRTRLGLRRPVQARRSPIKFRYPSKNQVGKFDLRESLGARNEPCFWWQFQLFRKSRPCFERHFAEVPQEGHCVKCLEEL